MNKKYLVAIAIAAVVVVALIVVIPSLGSDNGAGVVQGTGTSQGQTAPPIAPGETLPEGHPDVSGSQGQQQSGPTTDEIVKAAEEAYKAKPKDLPTLLTLGDAYLQAGRSDDAVKIFNEALAVAPNSTEAKAGLAMADYVKGDTAGAQAKLEKLVQDDPKSQVALYDLAVLYFSGNQRDKAKEAWQKVVDIDAQSDLGQMSKQFLDLMSQAKGSGENPHSTGSTTATTAAQ